MEKNNSKNIYFTPVFIEPTIKHSLLQSYKYTYIIIFEIITVMVLLFLFFKSEIHMLFKFKQQKVISPIDKFSKTTLYCKENKLFISGLPNTMYSKEALSLNRQPITYKYCNDLLQSINGSQQVSINDILRK
ncbi:putative membrane protein [Lumpy skin disease virus]|nr:LW064 [Lumpy skin disease virus]WMT10863.1 putative membrane protein [Lumpy skin disease virus]